MEPKEALDLVVAWGFVFIIACAFVGIGISFLREGSKDDL